jgi:plasmid stability protein
MANLQVKGIDDGLYEQLKRLAITENRSVSQEIIFLLKAHLASPNRISSTPSPAEVLLQLSGAWEDSRPAEEIVAEIRNARENSQRLAGGL